MDELFMNLMVDVLLMGEGSECDVWEEKKYVELVEGEIFRFKDDSQNNFDNGQIGFIVLKEPILIEGISAIICDPYKG